MLLVVVLGLLEAREQVFLALLELVDLFFELGPGLLCVLDDGLDALFGQLLDLLPLLFLLLDDSRLERLDLVDLLHVQLLDLVVLFLFDLPQFLVDAGLPGGSP